MICNWCRCRPYGVHTIIAGQFPVWRGAGGAQCRAALHCVRIPKPNHQMAEGRSAIAFGFPLDAAHHRPHHRRTESWRQRKLHLRGHQQLWIQRSDRSPQCHRWVKETTQKTKSSWWCYSCEWKTMRTVREVMGGKWWIKWTLGILSTGHITAQPTDLDDRA